MRGRAIYKADQKRLMQVPILENEDIDKLLKPFIQGDVLDGDASAEEGTKRLQHSNEPVFVRDGEQVSTSDDSQPGGQPERNKSPEESSDLYKPF
jgi:hypothetical protein